MANTNVFPLEDTLVVDGVTYGEARGSKFVDFAGLDYFWSKAKSYVDAADAALAARATALETTVNGTPNAEGVYENGLVQKVDALRSDVDALGGAEGGIQGMIDASIEALDLDNKFAGADTAAQGYATDAAAGALKDAKAYVDGIVEDTKAEDGTVTAKGLKSQIADVAGALDSHVKDTVAHITAQERADWNAAKADIDAFLSDNDLTQDVVDTLTEIQSYITSDLAAADEMVKRVGALETSVGAAATTGEDGSDVPATGLYLAIDEINEAMAGLAKDLDDNYYTKTEVDGLIGVAAGEGTDATGLRKEIADAANTAETNANAYTDELFGSVTFIGKDDIDSIFA